MPLPLILYYGSSGLESQVFQSYMASSGFKVQVVTTGEAARTAIDANPSAIAVVALETTEQELVEQARELLARGDSQRARVFILSTQDQRAGEPPGIEVIPRPFRLSELVRRIQNMTRNRNAPDHSPAGA